jgi:biotin transport system substrate-specific component
MRMSMLTETLRTAAVTEVVASRRVRMAIGILAFALATSFGATIAVPLPGTAVPMSLQPLFVILSGTVLGAWGGAAAMALYLAMGAMGAPVFALGGAGLPWLLGPTGGYLVAMPAAAFVAGVVAGRGRGWGRLLAGLALGLAVIYLGGLSRLFVMTGQDAGALLRVGVLPFLAGDVAKILAAALLTRTVESRSPGR